MPNPCTINQKKESKEKRKPKEKFMSITLYKTNKLTKTQLIFTFTTLLKLKKIKIRNNSTI